MDELLKKTREATRQQHLVNRRLRDVRVLIEIDR